MSPFSFAVSTSEYIAALVWAPCTVLANNQLRLLCSIAHNRRNWMFFNSENGAKSGSDMYSLIVSAKENKLKPYDYLKYIFEKLPNIDLDDEEALDKIMPWSTNIPEEIKSPKKA